MRIEAYPDRLRVTNPGGLHGEISRTRLFSEPLTSSRNSHLARLVEDVEIPRVVSLGSCARTAGRVSLPSPANSAKRALNRQILPTASARPR